MLYQMCDIAYREEEMPWPKIGATQNHSLLRLPDKGGKIKEVTVVSVFLNLILNVNQPSTLNTKKVDV